MIQAESVITFWKLSANLDLAFRLWIQRICTQDNPELLHESYCSFLFPELINEKFVKVLLYHSNWTYLYQIKQRG